MADGTKIQPVVTCFLKRANKVALFLRSAKVSHYRNYWAGISGFLEHNENPLDRAEREIEEETGLIPPDALPVLEGRPLIIQDRKRTWLVHPFLFEARSLDTINLDREHTEYRMAAPDEFHNFKVIPGLPDAYRRVDLPDSIIKKLEALRINKSSGSAELASEAVDVLLSAGNTINAQTQAEYLDRIIDAGWHLQRTRPNMAPVQYEVASVLNLFKKEIKPKSSVQALKLALKFVINKHRKERKEARKLLQDAALKELKKYNTLLTHSYSTSVVDLLTEWAESGKRLFVTESRPGYEGHGVARLLSRICDVNLITEAQAGNIMTDVDAVVTGADGILADGSVLNKAGTYMIALAAKDKRKKFYVVADSTKFHPGSAVGMDIPQEIRDAGEVFSEYSARIRVINSYFDNTPERLITGIFTENGLLKNIAVKNHAKKSAQVLKIFGELGNYRVNKRKTGK